ncbi:hypothetical protein M0R19_04590 [Candidatus Pacearchaeota archaeon]|jgi:hypothetical protein|nr:hypothetical protein [Candidatus Pacearchaeota archaeon]
MSFPGPRERKEPSPPFKDPNPDKGKALVSLRSGNKIVKLTKIGTNLKQKINKYYEFKAQEEVQKYGIDNYLDFYNSLPKESQQAIKEYTEAGFGDVNRSLRFITQITPSSTRMEKVKRIIKGLDYAFKQKEIETKKNLILYRSIDSDFVNRINKVFYDEGFVSTTGYKNALHKRNAYIKIRVPKGSKIIFTRPFDEMFTEGEFLLNRNSRFEVIKKYKDDEYNAIEVKLA